MVRRRIVHQRMDEECANNIKKLYPTINGFPNKTTKLNEVLEEMIYGKKKIR